MTYLSINEPLELPLTPEQVEQLRDVDSFSLEEEFYILQGSKALDVLISGFYKAGHLGNDAPTVKTVRMREDGIAAAALNLWFSNRDDLPEIPEGEVTWPDGSLDEKKLEWGRTICKEIAKDKKSIDVWAFRFEELLTTAVSNTIYHANASHILFKTPKECLENHHEMAEAEAFLADHKLEVIREIRETRSDVSMALLATELGNYIKENDGIRSKYVELKSEAVNRFKEKLDKLEVLGVIKTESKRDKKGPEGILESIQKLFGVPIELCKDPNCPVHGKQNKTATETSSNQQLLDSSKESTTTTMAIEKKDEKKKDELMFKNVTVQFVDDPNNKAIALPAGMTLKEGQHWLRMIELEETRTFVYQYTFTGWAPLDAMWAAYRALAELHGFVHVADFQNWFGPTPPSMITIDIDYGKTQQMPWGPIQVSGFSSNLVPDITLVEGQPTLRFSAEIRNNERITADKLMKRAEEMLRTASIYRGKAIDVDFEVVHPRDFRFDPTKAPKFWDTSKTNIDELILSKSVERLVRTSIWTPIRKTEQARLHQIPLRRSVLLAGSYGVGKTLAARATAKVAQDHGWTFLYLRKLNQLKEALYFAKKYQPCVVFAEDINRITSGKRDTEMDELFNVIDGVDRKNDEVMLVFTTNDIDEIHPGMIRPGRIDTIITVTPPDQEAVERLIRLYGRGLVDPNADLTAASRKLAGQIPAIIREAVEWSKLAAIEDNTGGDLVVGSDHLEIAADRMLVHAEFLKEPEPDRPDMEVLGEAFGRVMVDGLCRSVNGSMYDTTDPDVKNDAKLGLSEIIKTANLGGNGNGHLRK